MEKFMIAVVLLLFVGAKPIPEKPLSVKWNVEIQSLQGVEQLKNDLVELDSLCARLPN